MVATQKVVYQDQSKSEKEFFVYVHSDIYDEWKDDKSVPVNDVIQAYNIYSNRTGGSTGVVIAPSKGELEKVFGTSQDSQVVEYILNHGAVKGFSHPQREEMERPQGAVE
ncbi:FYSH domain-containing protein [Basidiobolus meristosporus CBS 931.73]|uniref:FYSH domain-containing protein n=1 Tax=Basidiobolus meristosporus CBS 931.73 TaxID=1314790 RepID=A0A1Y1YH39_9FUNG|nr:FYSH domain-containing protein [Basidiobolus meristosporus CBS 931.73]|eukprot:ORX97036.1 FYSH domain-containing protein [Basidiobolus meristosporus CBS 931.73]